MPTTTTPVDLTPVAGAGLGTGQFDASLTCTPDTGGGGVMVQFGFKNTTSPITVMSVALAKTTEKSIAVPPSATGFCVVADSAEDKDIEVRASTGVTAEWLIKNGFFAVAPKTMPATIFLYASDVVEVVQVAFW